MKRMLLGLIRAYQLLLSPWLGNSCRFEPTCSRYATQAIEEHGAAAGTCLALRRLLRCHPWCEGGHDPVPAERPHLHFPWSRRITRQPAHPGCAIHGKPDNPS